MQVQGEELLPPGFRFFPTEEELISFYLHNKLQHTRPDIHRVIPVVDIYDFEPEELPKLSGELCRGDPEQWFFFVPRQEREARGGRPNRTTESGYWKATGSPSYVYSSDDRVIGVKKTMVFYKGRTPAGRKTKWKMNEYRSIIPKLRLECCLCRMYVISGTFRGFDRRPPAANTGDAYFGQQPQGQGDDDEAATSSQKAPAVEVTSSADNSNSLGNCPNFPKVAASADWDMVHGTETLWELEDWLQDA